MSEIEMTPSLYKMYEAWCEDNNVSPSYKEFMQWMEEIYESD